MVRIQCRLKIGIVASDTVRRGILICPVGVALCTICNGVTQSQWKKAVIHLVGIPVDLVDIMTFRAVGGEVVLDVVRTGGGLKILEVAVDTIITQPVEPETGFRVVAIGTADGCVGAD